MLLIFLRGASRDDTRGAGGVVPGHDGAGPAHMALAIDTADYDRWRAHLEQAEVTMRGEMCWPLGGRSLYFKDPDGHVLELATPGLWPNY